MLLEKGRILPGKLIVEPLEERKQTAGGILIPTSVLKPKTQAGKVLLVSDDLPNFKTDIKVGDCILYPPHSYVSIEHNELPPNLRLLNKADVLFIWQE